MKSKFVSLFALAAGLAVVAARAQTVPTTPAPVLDSVAAPAPSQVVYAPRLPSAVELTNVAAAQGLSVDRIVQTAGQITVVYRSANGQTNTVAYQLLPTAGAPAVTVVAATPPPRVVYVQPAPRYYYDPFYDPFYNSGYYGSPWYGPVSLSLGVGWVFHGGGGHGGHHRH
jgi:hypothetical protein